MRCSLVRLIGRLAAKCILCWPKPSSPDPCSSVGVSLSRASFGVRPVQAQLCFSPRRDQQKCTCKPFPCSLFFLFFPFPTFAFPSTSGPSLGVFHLLAVFPSGPAVTTSSTSPAPRGRAILTFYPPFLCMCTCLARSFPDVGSFSLIPLAVSPLPHPPVAFIARP